MKNFHKTAAAALGAVAALGGTCSVSQAAPAPSRPTPADAQFMKTLAQGGIAEVKLGKLALIKTRNTRVHNVAVTIVQDHTQANAALKQVARREGVMLPPDMNARHKMIYARLSRLSGPAFNRSYITGQVKDHDKTVAMITHEEMVTHDALLLAFLKQTLPKIQMHTRELHQIQESMRMGHGGPMQHGLKHTSGLVRAHH